MAQQKYYKPYGALEVKAGSKYTTANIPVGTDIVELLRGVRIADEKGEKTRIWGVRVSINPVGITPATTPLPNVPFIWKEGAILIFDPSFIYTFEDNGLVGYGAEVVV